MMVCRELKYGMEATEAKNGYEGACYAGETVRVICIR